MLRRAISDGKGGYGFVSARPPGTGAQLAIGVRANRADIAKAIEDVQDAYLLLLTSALERGARNCDDLGVLEHARFVQTRGLWTAAPATWLFPYTRLLHHVRAYHPASVTLFGSPVDELERYMRKERHTLRCEGT